MLKRVINRLRAEVHRMKKLLSVLLLNPMFARICQQRCSKSARRIVANRGKVVRVAFLHMYAASNQTLRLFDLMLKDDAFDPYFIVNPDVLRSNENARYNYNKTRCELIDRYGVDRVLDGISEGGNYVDFTGKFDLMTTNNPYEDMAAQYFKITYWAKHGVPSFYTSYFYMGRCKVSRMNIQMLSSSCLWRFFADNETVMAMARDLAVLHGRNFVLSGSPKMDGYANIVPAEKSKLRVMVAPHHSIGNVYPQNSAFLEYADDLFEIMKEFSNIDFVFRPHPLLWENLQKEQHWGVRKTEAYMAKVMALPNVCFSKGGDYLQEFADSDALIHDCGSFAAEYLFTGKPCAYIYRPSLDITTYSELGQECIRSHYLIYKREDLCGFLEKVVIGKNDYMIDRRRAFAREHLMYNYPHASEAILENIKQALGRSCRSTTK